MKQRKIKIIAAFFITLIGWDISFPIAAIALTGGPSQPEVQSFEPVGTTEMVDVFSGDFVYNIPLLDVEGFPINISYHSGVGMDDEASWVGLGWNINPGVVNRNMRGVPDDFNGNPVTSTTNIKNNETWGVTLQPTFEIFGKRNKFFNNKEGDTSNKMGNYPPGADSTGIKLEVPTLNVSLGVTYNNYRGLGYEFSLNPKLSLYKRESNSQLGGLGMNLSASSYYGADIDANLSYSHRIKREKKDKGGLSFGAGTGINSRQGMRDVSFNYGFIEKQKANRQSKLWGRSSSISLNPISYTPEIQNEMKNISLNLSVTLGPEVVGWWGKLGITGNYSNQALKHNSRTLYSYGYMFSHDGVNNPSNNTMFDLNRENDGGFTKDRPLLPMPVFTYDMFNVSGEGTGGMFRPYRSDAGVMFDAFTRSNTVGLGLAGEFGMGNAVHGGIDLSANYGYQKSGAWKADKDKNFDIINNLSFQKPTPNSSFEPYYFRSTGEKTVANNDIYATMGYDEPVRAELDGKRLKSNLISKSGNHNVHGSVKYNDRQRRNMLVASLSNYEAAQLALDKDIKLYERNSFSLMTDRQMVYDSTIERYTNDDYDHQLSELTVTNPDGRRYVYGVPAYNYTQQDVVFRVIDSQSPSITQDRSIGLVNYSSDDNSLSNSKGEDNFYNKTEIPGYAHSFLLSSVLSTDYVDVTGNGVSDDDIGTAIKFNYTRAYKNYKWRTPYGRSQNQGNYDEGLKSDKYDDKASYIYGEKEIWYVHSIESKNYVACFYTSPRSDANQVAGENGGLDSTASFYKLDSIRLFTKEELIVNGANATPLKTVHFEYDYSLCPNAENNKLFVSSNAGVQPNTGKLTLKKIYFTYGKSRKGRTNSYQFTYDSHNPKYNLRGYDRWGNFKPNASKSECDDLSNSNTRLSNADDPYVLQNKDSADLYASAWSLTQIKLPSGGTINVNYEADDYAYIQDKQAGQMFKVSGINNSTTFSASGNSLFIGEQNYLYLFFDLAEPFSDTAEYTKKINDYFAGIDKMYFKFLVDLTSKGDYDFVSGYADKSEVGFSSKNPSSGIYDVGYVKLKGVSLKDRRGPLINPITKASWNFMRMNAPKKLAKIFSNFEMAPGDTKGAFKSLAGSFVEMANMYRGFGRTMRAKGAGQKFVLNKSIIRLNNPSKQKFGGGVRVKQLTLSDAWDEMVSGQEASSYGQKYLYTKEEKQADGTYRTISSGVATWEPGIGGDENSHKQPVSYASSNTLAPDDQYMIEKPIGESFFPAPSVGYSMVTTVNIKPTENIKRTATGKVVNEFFTAYDFPVIVKHTDVGKRPKNPKLENMLWSILKVYVKDRMYVTQGYSIELNDMHGKPKAQWVYEEDNKVPISGVKYEYQYTKNEFGTNKLVSNVDVVNPDGSISNAEIGREIDYMTDTRNFYSFHAGGTLEVNFDGGLAGFFPVLASSLFGSITMQELEFASAVNTKVITRYGILKSTEVFENGASVKTHNVLFDSETGDVLLAKTTNEFNDTIYTFNYPAHFAYEGMGQAYKNIGYWFKDIKFYNGELKNLSNYTSYFVPGDELYVEMEKYNSTTSKLESITILDEKAWAVTSPHDPNDLIFLTRAGNAYETRHKEDGKTFKYNIKIIRSGRRNMQSASIGTVVSLANPVSNGYLAFDSVINAGAVEFSDYWATKYVDLGFSCPDSCVIGLIDSLFSPNIAPNLRTLPMGGEIELLNNPYRENFWCAADMYDCYKCWPFYRSKHKIKKTASGGPGFSSITLPGGVFGIEDIRYASITPIGNRGPVMPEDDLITERMAPMPPSRSENITSSDFNFSDCDSVIKYTMADSLGDTCYFEICLQCVDEAFNTATKIHKGSSYPLAVSTTWPGTIATPACEGKKTRALMRMHCTSDTEYGCGKSLDLNPINPYVLGIKGNWRAKRNWLFYEKRNQASTTNIRKDGTYKNYVDFWKRPVLTNTYWDTGTSINKNWTWNTTVTKFNRTGNEIENVDALNIYSSALFGYGNSIVKAVGSNTRHRQLAYDGFEDYSTLSPDEDHFSYYQFKENLTTVTAHTGAHSIRVSPNQSVYVTKGILYHEEITGCQPDTSDNHYIIKPSEILEEFSPDTGYYHISCWVKDSTEYNGLPQLEDSIFVSTSVSSGAGTFYSFSPSGPVIDGWQRYEGKFYVPQNAVCINVMLQAGTKTAYFDDLRIHPWNANMKSFVYHPRTLRLVATLDENNYATFYEYDDEGRLVRIKRETERGIVTLQESRTGLKINE
ncbi:MAG: hypothetical protein F9K23_08665 [Bacteroidetes bacterium]|nr:MAG: hypothetical protein F9K23_08665 [Bacteroidota bacterium]